MFVNKKNKKWKSLQCPDCIASNNSKIAKEARLKAKLEEELEEAMYGSLNMFHDHRTCRNCKNKLETSRWWYCSLCKPFTVSDAWDDYIYTNSIDNLSEMNYFTSI